MRIVQLTTNARDFYRDQRAAAPYFSAPVEALLQGFAQMPGVEIHVVSCTKLEATAREKLAPNIFYHGLHVAKLGWMSTFYQGCVRAVRQELKEIRPDIVHGQGTENDCAIGAALSGCPNVVTLHGIMQEMVKVLRARTGSFFWLASLLESFALRRTSGALCISRFTEEAVRVRCRKTWRVPNALREPFFLAPLPKAGPPKCTILNVGTVCTYKRQNELLDLLEQLREEGMDFEAQFLGKASRENTYGARFLDRAQNRSYLSYRGFQSTDELINSFDQASALVHVSAIETFGLVVAEALARNLKFFGFKSGGVADIGENVEQAELFADGDWAGLKNRLAHWIRSGFPRPTTAAATMRKRYHPAEIARRHLEIYREVLNRPS